MKTKPACPYNGTTCEVDVECAVCNTQINARDKVTPESVKKINKLLVKLDKVIPGDFVFVKLRGKYNFVMSEDNFSRHKSYGELESNLHHAVSTVIKSIKVKERT